MTTGQLVIIRHGQSDANAKNVFAGWVDTHLTETGKEQAKKAGEALRNVGFRPDAVYASTLTRAYDTAKIALAAAGLSDLAIKQDPALLERHYGGLTGMNKDEALKTFGFEDFKAYRRSYDIPPPPMGKDHVSHPDNPAAGEKVIGLPPNGKNTEALEDVVVRVQPFFDREILPRMKRGEKVLIAAHGNSLRALSMIIERMTQDEVKEYEIANGIPIRYTIDVPAADGSAWGFKREILG